MKQVFFTLLLLFAWWSGDSQNEIQVTTLDSFNTTAIGQQGVYGLHASTHNDLIHLSYFHSDQEARTWLLYSIRGDNTFVTDTILEIKDYIKSQSNTAIQFDSTGTPWIYAGYNSNNIRAIKAFTKGDSAWVESFSVNQLGTPIQYVAAAPHGHEIGFAFCGVRIPPNNHYPIQYASFNGTDWNQVTISEVGKSEKTKPSIVFQDSTLYLAFAESRCPDTLITRVYMKKDSIWSIGFEDIWEGDYGCAPLLEITTKLGADEEGIYLFQETHLDDPFPQLHRFDGDTWEKAPVNFDESWVHPSYMGSNIHVDQSHTVYWINQEKTDQPGLSLIRPDGESGYITLPHDYNNIFLQDMIIHEGWVYVYYFEGSYNWPWGKPITFKEAKLNISYITKTDPNIELPAIRLDQNKPNPFADHTNIHFSIPHPAEVDLTIYNQLGIPVQTLVHSRMQSGHHDVIVKAGNLHNGLYFYRLSVEGKQITKPMILAN